MPSARTLAVLAVLPLLALACARAERLPPPARPKPVPSMFNPVSMRLHPTFTRVKAWVPENNTGKPDGIEAELEFSDEFGDPVKAEGRVIFELYEYRKDAADVRGTRITTPFVGSLLTEDEQRARWNRATRTYSFKLATPNLSASRSYVLTATFEPKAGPRFYSRIILQPSGT
jgi:hypothetical protein